MTIPTRPAPAPPSANNAAAGANASLERLRMQLEQQQQEQRQQHQQQKLIAANKLNIKLPPPPPKTTFNNGFYHSTKQQNENETTTITRKFPTARYAPAADWNDTPFDSFATTTTNNKNGFGKKNPPPRPPPPKINARKPTAPAPPISPRPPTSVNILSSIFNRKKQAKAAQNSSRIYGVSSGMNSTQMNSYSTWNTTTTSSSSNSAIGTNYNHGGTLFETCKMSNTSSTTTTTTTATSEAQLISFDSPPSSPTFTQKSNSDCVSVDSFSSDSNFSSPNNGSASQAESGFEDDFGSAFRSRQSTTSPLDPWETLETLSSNVAHNTDNLFIGTAPVRNLNSQNTRFNTDNPLCNGKSLLPPAPSLQMPTIIKPKISQKPKAPKPPALQTNKYAALSTLTTNYNSSSGVSILDVISGKSDALELSTNHSLSNGVALEGSAPYGIALYDFDGQEEGDLCFRENEKIYLLEQVSAEWYRGRSRSGCEGIFPINYVDIKVPLTFNGTGRDSTTTTTSTNTTTTNQYPTARSLYNFNAEVEGDLALRENDLVTIYYKINDDWLYGEVENRVGQFPANFLDYVPANLPPMPQY